MCQNNGHGLICAWNKSLDWPATTQGGITTATSLKPTKKKLTEVQKNHRKKKKKKVVAVGRRWQNRDRRVKTVLFSLVLIFKTVCQTYVDHGLGFQNGQRNT
jgi:hypothetical protein